MTLTLLTAIFLASLLGSLHCAGMCGAFVALAVAGENNWRRHLLRQAAYHGGRLISYLGLGIAGGLAGQLLDLGTALAGIGPVAALVAGITVVVCALIQLQRSLNVRIPNLPRPAWLSQLGQNAYRRAMNRPPLARALLIGSCSTLLPCGLLYYAVALAAGTASPAQAGVVMAVFWLGTLPLLAALGAGIGTILKPLEKSLPLITCLAMLAIGIFTIVGRAQRDPLALLRMAQRNTTRPVANMPKACCLPDDHTSH